MRWPRSDFALCSPRAQRTDSEMLLLPHPFGPTIAVMPAVTLTVIFSANDLKPCSEMDSRRMGFSSTAYPQQPKKKALAVGVPPDPNHKCRPSSAFQIVALLVLLTRSAITGVVAAELFAGRRAGRGLR